MRPLRTLQGPKGSYKALRGLARPQGPDEVFKILLGNPKTPTHQTQFDETQSSILPFPEPDEKLPDPMLFLWTFLLRPPGAL